MHDDTDVLGILLVRGLVARVADAQLLCAGSPAAWQLALLAVQVVDLAQGGHARVEEADLGGHLVEQLSIPAQAKDQMRKAYR